MSVDVAERGEQPELARLHVAHHRRRRRDEKLDLARQHGGGSLARALEAVAARTLLIAFSSDWLYPPSSSKEIHDALEGLGKPVELHVIEAPYGHDCFLLEEARQTPIIRQFLAERKEKV